MIIEITKISHMLKYVLLITKIYSSITIYVSSLNRISLSLLIKLLFRFWKYYLCLGKVYDRYLFGFYSHETPELFFGGLD